MKETLEGVPDLSMHPRWPAKRLREAINRNLSDSLEERADGRNRHEKRLFHDQWWEFRDVHKGGIVRIQHVV